MERTLLLRPALVAFFAGLLALTPTNVYKICAWNAGIGAVEAWRSRASAALRSVGQSLRAWFASLWTPRLAFACLAVLLAVLSAHLSASHDHGVLFAIAPLAELQSKRAVLLDEANKLKGADGKFADAATRSLFDTKMAEVETLDGQIREAQKPPATGTGDEATRAAAAAERERVLGIQGAVRAANAMRKDALPAAFETDLITRGVTIEGARAAIFAKLADGQERIDPKIEVGADAKDKFLRGAENWLLVKGGTAELVARHLKVDVKTMDPGEFRGMSLVDLARLALQHGGYQMRSFGHDKMRLVSDALTYRANITQSTSDFATLLENVMGKVLQAAYAIQPDTWKRFCATSTVSDFRAHNRYRMGSFGALDALNESGEFKNKPITDAEKGTITASTKGNIINVSRQMIINDDMSAFSRLLTMLGRAAALSIEVDVYALLTQNAGLGPTLLDGLTLFHASHNNIGTGTALTAAGIDTDRVTMAQQKDKDGNDFIDLRPAILVLPVSLGGQAKVINLSQYDPDNIANKAQMRPNVVAGLFRDIVDTPRLSGTRRYLFADPGIAPVLEVAFLEGQTEPVLETQDGWRVDGAEMKVRFDYGVAAVDFRGAETNAGA